MSQIKICKGYIPGAIGRVVELHGQYYHKNWGFEAYFEIKVAAGLSEFISRYDDARDRFWTVTKNGRIEGSLSIDGIHANDEGAHLRWFIISDRLRGQGIGQKLIKMAVEFCRKQKYARIYLWTFEGLFAARHLYDKAGFKVVEQRTGTEWGVEVKEQRLMFRL